MTACSQETTDGTNSRVQVGCCQLEVENPPLDRGRAWLPNTAQTPALPQASAKVTSLCSWPRASTGTWSIGRIQHWAGSWQGGDSPQQTARALPRVTLDLAALDQAGIAVLGKGNGEKSSHQDSSERMMNERHVCCISQQHWEVRGTIQD